MPYLKANWPLSAKIHAFTTLRPEGYSQDIFAGLNLSYRVQDDANAVDQNVTKLVQEMQLPYRPEWIHQVHGAKVVNADQMLASTEADGVYTHQSGKICAVLTADCLPILLCHPKNLGIAALHAGWRSLHQGIVEAGLNALNLPAHELYVWLGPAIAQKAYVVGNEFREAFLDLNPRLSEAFYQDEDQQWHGDLYAIAKTQLQDLGVQHIYGGEYCTYSDPTRFYSARYSLRHNDHTGGRMATLIWVENNAI